MTKPPRKMPMPHKRHFRAREPDVFGTLHIRAADALKFSKRWITEPLETGYAYTKTPLGAAMITASLRSPDDNIEQLLLQYVGDQLALGCWAMSGFPVVTMDHRTAALLMSTRIRPDDAEEFVRPPWPAWLIKVPTPLLTIGGDTTSEDASLLLVAGVEVDRELSWFTALFSDSGVELFNCNVPTRLLATKDLAGVSEYERWDMGREWASSDERSNQLSRALIVGTCLHLSGDPRKRVAEPVQDGVTVTSRRTQPRIGDHLPSYDEFELRSSINIDLHHVIRDYVRHGGKSPSIQTLVPGHWKRVAHGPAHSLRRMQHIQPYWRGPLDAPISARCEVMR